MTQNTAIAVNIFSLKSFLPTGYKPRMSSSSSALPSCFALYRRLGFQVVSGVMSWDASLKDGVGGKATKFDGGSWKKSDKFPNGGALKPLDARGNLKSLFALRCGEESGCFAVDIDDPELEHNKKLAQLCLMCSNMVARTRRGLHFLFAYRDDIPSTSSAERKIDIQSNGKLLYVEPSFYTPTGEDTFEYKWISTPSDGDTLAEISEEALTYLSEIMGWDIEKSAVGEDDDNYGSVSDNESQVSTKSKEAPSQPSIIKDEDNRKMIEKLLLNISPKHFDDYADWVRIGYICYNEGCGFKMWEKATKAQYKKFASGKSKRCEGIKNAWESIERGASRDKRIKQRRLWEWLRVDNPTKYVEMMKEREDFFVFLECVNHAEVAQMFYDLCSDAYVYHNDLGWYEINKYNVWEHHGKSSPPGMVNKIWETLKNLAMEHLPYIDPFSKDSKERKKADNLIKFRSVIGNSMFCSGVVKFLPAFYHYEELPSVMDESRHLFAFDDKVFDLNTCEYRAIKPDDWVCLTTGYKAPQGIKEAQCHKVLNVIKTMFHDDDMTKYVMSELMIHLHGDGQRSFQRFNIWTGSGGNGKGVLADTIKSAFGKYYITLPITILTEKADKKDQPCPKLAEAKGRRIAMAQEPEGGCWLQGGLIKDLTGDGEIVARQLYANPITYRPQFGLFLQCNAIPNIKLDGGVERRFCITPFPYQFVPNPKRQSERKGDPFIKEFMVSTEARDGFITLLLEMYRDWVKRGRPNDLYEGAYIPSNEHIKNATRAYISSNNILEEWLKEHWDITGNQDDIVQARECYTIYKGDMSGTDGQKAVSEVVFAQVMAYNKIPKENFTNAFSRTDDEGNKVQYKAGKYYIGLRRKAEVADIEDD